MDTNTNKTPENVQPGSLDLAPCSAISPGDRVKIKSFTAYNGNRWINLINSHIGEEAVVREVRDGGNGISVNLVSDGHGFFLAPEDYDRSPNPKLTDAKRSV